MISALLKTIFITVLVFVARPTFAAEIKILDAQGLIRALKQIKNPAKVIIRARDPKSAPASITLEPVDIIQPYVQSANNGSGEYQFSNIAPGTWKVAVEKGEVTLAEVVVTE